EWYAERGDQPRAFSSLTRAVPTVPLAPVTRIMAASLSFVDLGFIPPIHSRWPREAVWTIPEHRPTLERVAFQSNRALEELASFAAVVEANGFTAAARASGARKATLSLRVLNLETRLGVSLLVRTT